MPLFPGAGARVRERMLLIKDGKYRRADGEPDVRSFCFDYRYSPTVVYFWLRDRSTPTKELARLAKDLGVEPAWLLFGPRKARTGSQRVLTGLLLCGVLAGSGTPAVVHVGDKTTSYRKSRRGLGNRAVWLMAPWRAPSYTPLAA